MSPLKPRMIPAVQGTNRPSRGQEGRFRPRQRLVIPPFHSPVLGYGLVADQAHSKGPFRPSALAYLRSRITRSGLWRALSGEPVRGLLGRISPALSGPWTPRSWQPVQGPSRLIAPRAAACSRARARSGPRPSGSHMAHGGGPGGADQLRARALGSRCRRSHRPSDTTGNVTRASASLGATWRDHCFGERDNETSNQPRVADVSAPK